MSNEWYTPTKYVEAAREVMGSIDLDPASCEFANQIVKATKYYSIKDNGLLQEWHGCIWLNPPYGVSAGKSIQGIWLDRLIEHYITGKVEQAIFLGTANPEANWFQPLWNYPICFASHQVHFHVADPLAQSDKHVFGTCFAYLGPDEDRFTEVFRQFGYVAKAIGGPKVKPKNLELWTA